MLKILVLIAINVVFLFSKELPMMQKIDLYMTVKGFSIVEFPFKIKDKKFGPFSYQREVKQKTKPDTKKASKQDNEAKTKEDPLAGVKLPKSIMAYKKKLNRRKKKMAKAGKTPLNSNNQPIKITSGDNFIQFYSKIEGKTELVVYGYKKYPMIINLIFTKNKMANSFIRFTDIDDTFAKNPLKGAIHDRICTQLIYDLYNNINPTGYKVSSPYHEYKQLGLKFVLVKELVGQSYKAVEYRVTNISGGNLSVKEPDYTSGNSYAVSILNRELKKDEATRLFIVLNKGSK